MATRTALGAGLVVGTLVLSIVGVAEAQAPRSATPIQCLQAWDQDGISVDYVGDGWVEAPVADINGIFLGCGDATTGMVHIARIPIPLDPCIRCTLTRKWCSCGASS